MIQCGDCPSYRVATIELTDEQRRALILEKTGSSNGHDIIEKISHAILV